MNAFTMRMKLEEGLRQNSGLDMHRPYLGMSRISECPRRLWHEFMNGRSSVDDRVHWFCWTGNLFHDGLQKIFPDIRWAGYEVVARFDARYRGHVDFDFDGALLEFKTLDWAGFQEFISGDRQPRRKDYEQVQAYMRHGPWTQAFIIYLARDMPYQEFREFPFWVCEVYRNSQVADELDRKARRVLQAVDKKVPPICECRRCRY